MAIEYVDGFLTIAVLFLSFCHNMLMEIAPCFLMRYKITSFRVDSQIYPGIFRNKDQCWYITQKRVGSHDGNLPFQLSLLFLDFIEAFWLSEGKIISPQFALRLPSSLPWLPLESQSSRHHR